MPSNQKEAARLKCYQCPTIISQKCLPFQKWSEKTFKVRINVGEKVILDSPKAFISVDVLSQETIHCHPETKTAAVSQSLSGPAWLEGKLWLTVNLLHLSSINDFIHGLFFTGRRTNVVIHTSKMPFLLVTLEFPALTFFYCYCRNSFIHL